jgi:transmembrane sensor
MSDLESRIRAASAELTVEHDGVKRAELRLGIESRLVKRVRRRRVVAAGIALTAAALMLVSFIHFRSKSVAPPPVAIRTPAAASVEQPVPPSISFVDGSSARFLSLETRLFTERDTANETLLRLESGGAEFAVRPRGDRPFVVRSGLFEVSVVGTKFALLPLDRGRLRVSVFEGKVDVRSPSGTSRLVAGDTREFPGEALPPDSGVMAAPRPSSGTAHAGEWRKLAGDRNYGPAYEALTREGISAVQDEPGDLLLAADVARLSGHPADAVAHLSTLIRRFPGDSRAASAGFTLGRVFEQLGKPSDAARSFARARSLQPAGPLAEDALAHEVESLAKAGRASDARLRAIEYLAKYPNGRRARAVRAHVAPE